MKIDAHINISDSGFWGINKLNVLPETILKSMDENQIDKACLFAINGIASNETLVKYLDFDPQRFIGFGNIEDYTDLSKSLKKLKDLNINCVKIHPRFEKISIDELDQLGVFKALEENSILLNICGWLQSSSTPIESLEPNKIDFICKKYPKLKIILSHLGGHKYWDAFFAARANSNLYLDTSYFMSFFKGTSLYSDFLNSAHKIDQKLIFGSDFPEISIGAELKLVDELVELNKKFNPKGMMGENLLTLI